MYIYQLPFNIDKELCRLLDNDDLWKDLGSRMQYTAFDINEIEQTARRMAVSPTSQLLTRWGQLNHRVEELFVLLYRMKHRPALNCIKPLVSERYHRLLAKRDSKNSSTHEISAPSVDENGNRPPQSNSIPLLVKPLLIDQGQLTSSSPDVSVSSRTDSEEQSSTIDESRCEGEGRSADGIEELIRRQVCAIPHLKYEELCAATGGWSPHNLLGRGGFGQVYKGEWKLLTVAVKRLQNNDGKAKELIQEMCLNQYRHDNILSLYGYSLGGAEACLVYQLMAGGSLEDRLRCKRAQPPLTWPQRHRIAHGVARGLQFLHTLTGTPLIHGDIKPANILLDACLVPKIGDFGLARKGPFGDERTHLKVSKVHGTRPYLPEEYLRSHCLSPAVDVFSFGVVLLELGSALPARQRDRPAQLLRDHVHLHARGHRDLAELEDPLLVSGGGSCPALCRAVLALGIQCTEAARQQRPAMLLVFRRLDAMHFPGRHTD